MERWHCGRLVNPEDPADIATAVQYLLDRSEKAWQMRENGWKAVKGEFNWDVEVKKLLVLYEEILNEK